MRKKSIISILVVVFISMLACTDCFAEDLVVFYANFNSDSIDSAPSKVYGLGTEELTASDVTVKNQDGEICADILRSKHMTAVFDEQITEGVFCVQFDAWQSAYGPLFCCLLNTDAYNVTAGSASCMRYLALTASPTMQTYSAKGYSTDNAVEVTDDGGEAIKYSTKKWNHFKIIFDMDAKKMQISVNDKLSKIYDSAFLDNPIGAINFFNGGGNGAERFIDNVKVYIPDNTPKLSFVDYNGVSCEASESVAPMIEKIKLEFPYPLPVSLTDSDFKSILLENTEKKLTNLSYEMSTDRKTVYLGINDGVLEGDMHYTLTLPGDAFNHGDDVCFKFGTSELSDVFEILGMGVEGLTGDELTMPSSGETANLWIEYIKNGDVQKNDAMLLCTVENDGVLVGAQFFEVEFGSNGKVKINVPITFSDKAFDFVGIYLWDSETFTPLRTGTFKEI